MEARELIQDALRASYGQQEIVQELRIQILADAVHVDQHDIYKRGKDRAHRTLSRGVGFEDIAGLVRVLTQSYSGAPRCGKQRIFRGQRKPGSGLEQMQRLIETLLESPVGEKVHLGWQCGIRIEFDGEQIILAQFNAQDGFAFIIEQPQAAGVTGYRNVIHQGAVMQ